MDQTNTRPAALAGTWYQADPQQLQREIDQYIQAAPSPQFSGEVVALVAPHAGHRYSGPVAGYSFRAILGKQYETVAVVSPYHSGHREPLLTSSHESYSTPLGQIPVDLDSIAALNSWLGKEAGLELNLIWQDQEHAIEIELPFLQVALSGPFQLLPVMLAGHAPEAALTLGTGLAEVLQEKSALLIASTDLSHFYPEEKANRLDQAMLKAIASMDPRNVIEVQRSGKGQACGSMAVLAVMAAAKGLGASQGHIFHYATSGSTSGNFSRVVGYGAGAFTRPL